LKDSTLRRKYNEKKQSGGWVYSTPWLLGKTTEVFNAWVRERDKDLPCISCGKWSDTKEAGHYFPSTVSSLRFNIRNVNGQCKQCNRHFHGNQVNYRKGLLAKYGSEKTEWMEIQADSAKRTNFKWERMELIELIIKYKNP